MANRCSVHGLAWLLFLITGCRSQSPCGFMKPGIIRLSGATQAQVITSPGYPHNYPHNANCAWRVMASHGYAIHLHLDWMELELAEDCIYDNVSLYDGQSINNPLLRSLCGERSGSNYYSSGPQMYVTFRSDVSDNSDGFRLEVKAIPAWAVPSPTPDPWLTTPRPTTSTARTTTTSEADSAATWQSHINTATLIGGLTGGLLLLFVCCALCRYYYSRSHPPHRLPCPSPAPLPPNTTSSSTVFQNHNAVFMVSPPGAGSGGHTNYAFAPYGEAPPAYFSVQQTYTHMASGGARRGTATGADGSVYPLPPPSYSETMMLTHPPSGGGGPAAHHPYPYPLPLPPPFSAAVSSPSSIPPAPRRPAPPPPARATSGSDAVTSGSGYPASGSGFPLSSSGYPPSSSGSAVPPSHEALTLAGISVMASPPNYSVATPPNQSAPSTDQSVVSSTVGSLPLPRSLSLPANSQSSAHGSSPNSYVVPTSWPVQATNNTTPISTPNGHFNSTNMSAPSATNERAAASLARESTAPSGGCASPNANNPPEG